MGSIGILPLAYGYWSYLACILLRSMVSLVGLLPLVLYKEKGFPGSNVHDFILFAAFSWLMVLFTTFLLYSSGFGWGDGGSDFVYTAPAFATIFARFVLENHLVVGKQWRLSFL